MLMSSSNMIFPNICMKVSVGVSSILFGLSTPTIVSLVGHGQQLSFAVEHPARNWLIVYPDAFRADIDAGERQCQADRAAEAKQTEACLNVVQPQFQIYLKPITGILVLPPVEKLLANSICFFLSHFFLTPLLWMFIMTARIISSTYPRRQGRNSSVPSTSHLCG